LQKTSATSGANFPSIMKKQGEDFERLIPQGGGEIY